MRPRSWAVRVRPSLNLPSTVKESASCRDDYGSFALPLFSGCRSSRQSDHLDRQRLGGAGRHGNRGRFCHKHGQLPGPRSDQQLRFQLQITNNGTDNTQLAFSTNQDSGYISNTSLNPAYLFLGDSFDCPAPPISGRQSWPDGLSQRQFTGADSTFNGNPVSLSSSTTYLLASLTVTTLTGASPVVGDSFTISLVPTSGTGSLFGQPEHLL